MPHVCRTIQHITIKDQRQNQIIVLQMRCEAYFMKYFPTGHAQSPHNSNMPVLSMKRVAIPSFDKFMRPVLEYAREQGSGGIRSNDATEQMVNYFKLTTKEHMETLASGSLRVKDRTNWALTYLLNATLLERPSRGLFVITDEGRRLLDKTNDINLKTLEEYEEYRSFRGISDDKNDSEIGEGEKDTPDESLARAIESYRETVEMQILEEIKRADPDFLEILVPRLLKKMGYGKKIEHTGKTGDGGVDAIIYRDQLGFSTILVQAKRFQDAVPIKDVRSFLGVLRGGDGIFVTTSKFTDQTLTEVKDAPNLVLLNGKELARLLYDYDLCVEIVTTHEIKKLDEESFSY